MKEDSYFQKNNYINVTIKNILREMIGFKNLAAASDWLRYVILYFEGGYYFDTDIKFLINEKTKMVPDHPKHGFKMTAVKAFINSGDYIFKNKRFDEEKSISLISLASNNDVIATAPQHPILKICLKTVISKYRNMDITSLFKDLIKDKKMDTTTEKYVKQLGISIDPDDKNTVMSVKRWPFNEKANWKKGCLLGKFHYTVYGSGPNMFSSCVKKYVIKNMEGITIRELKSDYFIHAKSNDPKITAGIHFEPHCALSWTQTPDKKAQKSFDTDELLKITKLMRRK